MLSNLKMDNNKLKRHRLKKVKSKDVHRFKLKGIKTAKVVSVHSGDTCDLVFYRGETFVRYKCRLSGYDAPELDDEPSGELARDYLACLCMNDKPENPDYFDAEQIWEKKELQNKLDTNMNLVRATFGKFRKCGLPLVILLSKPLRTDQLII
jgi:hypothetical protein